MGRSRFVFEVIRTDDRKVILRVQAPGRAPPVDLQLGEINEFFFEVEDAVFDSWRMFYALQKRPDPEIHREGYRRDRNHEDE